MKQILKKLQNNHQGLVALITIVIISTAVFIIAFTAFFLGLGELDLSYIHQKGGEAFSIADSCIEEALRRLRLNPDYSGSSLNVGNGSCIINIVVNGDNRIITAESVVGEYHKKIQAEATLSGSDTAIISWQELTN